MKNTIYLVICLIALYGSLWLFNHINAWLGILSIIAIIAIIIKTISNKLITNKQTNNGNF